MRSKEILAGLRARAVMFVHVQQPLRVASKSSVANGGKPPSQYQMGVVWQHLHRASILFENDPDMLMSRDYNVFAGVGDASVSDTTERYRRCQAKSEMIEFLFTHDSDTDDMTRELLKSHAVAMRLRLEKDAGGAREFLMVDGKEGKSLVYACSYMCVCEYVYIIMPMMMCVGKFHNVKPNSREGKLLRKAVASSDLIESLFGVLDTVVRGQSKNLSFHSSSSIAAWQYNKTEAWLNALTPRQQSVVVSLCRSNGIRLKKESDKRELNAQEILIQRMESEVKENDRKIKNKVKILLNLKEKVLIKTRSDWNGMVENMTEASERREIALQLRLLNKRHGVPRKCLMTLTHGGEKIPMDIVRTR